MPKCWVCRKEIDPKKVNGIYTKYGIHYYCKNEDCQERFIEDAGDPPEEEFESLNLD